MKEQLVGYEIAELAQKKGFTLNTKYRYIEGELEREPKQPSDWDSDEIWQDYHYEKEDFKTGLPAPTQSLLQKWLREVYNIIVIVKPDVDEYHHDVHTYWESLTYLNTKDKKGNYIKITECETYEKALEKGLFYGLKMVYYATKSN